MNGMQSLRVLFSGFVLGFVLSGLAACNNGGGGVGMPPGTSPTLSLATDVQTLNLSWTAVSGATHYKLYEDPDGVSGYTQIGGNLAGTSYSQRISVHLYNWAQARYFVEACNSGGCGPDSSVVNAASAVLAAIGYVKASNTGESDFFGRSVAVSGDGNTLAVGADQEDSNATGTDGDQTNDLASNSGAVYVFTRTGAGWSQQAYVKASNTEGNDLFGSSLALSDDGNTLAVGAGDEDSSATGIDGDQANNSASGAGAVYVFTRVGSLWSQQAYVKASNTEADDGFGYWLALSGDGNTLAVGAFLEDSDATGIDGDQANNLATGAGAVYVFSRAGATWSQQAYVKASNTGIGDQFGSSLGLSDDGTTLAVGAFQEDSNATDIGGNQTDNSALGAGAVYVFTRAGAIWSQQAYVKASNTEAADQFGIALALSDDGNTLAVGAHGEDSIARGVEGNQADNSFSNAGAVYVFVRAGATWSQQAYVKASNTGISDEFGLSLTLSGDGTTLAVGAFREDSGATGIGGAQADDSANEAGAVYVFTRSGGMWSQRAYVKASNTAISDEFGLSLSLSGAGTTLAVGAFREDSSATGVNGNQADNSAFDAGAVYLF